MQDYPVFRPEKYSGVQLILSSPILSSSNTKAYNSSYQYNNNYTKNYRTSRIYDQPIYSSRSRKRSFSPPLATVPPPNTYQAQQRIKKQTIKGQSRIEYVPVQKKVTDYVDEQKYTVVPRKRTITDYKDIVRVDIVPRQVIQTDYYAVQHIRCYVPQVIPEHYVEYVPVERKNIKYQYIPVQRQILHYPQKTHEQQQSRYLGVKEVIGSKIYDNLRESDLAYWQREYGYVRGEPISVLNQKIRNKIEREKQQFFKQCQTRSTVENSQYYPSQIYR